MQDDARILIVDEETRDRAALKRILQPHYQVYVAENSRQVLELIYKDMIDVVTLNLQLSSVEPLELIKAIRQHDPDIEIIVSKYTDPDTNLRAFQYGVVDYVPKPFHIVEIMSIIKASLEKRALNLKLKNISQELMESEGLVSSDVADYTEEEKETMFKLARRISYHFIREQYSRTKTHQDYLELARVLASLLESKDAYTHGHSERVSYYSSIIAEKLDLSPEDRVNIQIAAYLHDIGKLGMSNILFKKRRLNTQEWKTIKQHPEKGIDLIESLCDSKNIIAYIRHHHERFDGNGYPHGLAGKSIPLGGRIIAIADSYDAITSDRPYRDNTMTSDEAQQEVIKCAGTQFDPYLANIFIEAIKNNNHISAVS
jgi:response regulator RpfG family c-di-GMP phosphodiesterase